MALATFQALCIDVNDLEAGAAFWAHALGLDVSRKADDPSDVVLSGPTPEHTVWPNPVPEPHTVKNRVHLDVRATVPVLEGATPVGDPGAFPWTVQTGPEGDELCVFTDDEVPDYRLKDVVVDARDHVALSQWWADVWGGTLVHDEQEGYSYLDDVPGVPFESFDFVPVAEPKTVKNRVHWDVKLAEGVGVEDLVARGAVVLRPEDTVLDGKGLGWTIMADPEGNEFCAFAHDAT